MEVLADGARGHLNGQLELQLIGDAFLTPGRILRGPLSDKRLTIRGWLCDPETQGIADLVGLDGIGGSRVIPTRFGS